MAALCLTSCRSSRTSTLEHTGVLAAGQHVQTERTDSAYHAVRLRSMQPVPMEQARLTLPDEALASLPPLAAYTLKEGRAEVSARREADGRLTVSATCDSLQRVTELYEAEYTYLAERCEQLADSLRVMHAQVQERKPPDSRLKAFCKGLLCGAMLAGAAAAGLALRKKN